MGGMPSRRTTSAALAITGAKCPPPFLLHRTSFLIPKEGENVGKPKSHLAESMKQCCGTTSSGKKIDMLTQKIGEPYMAFADAFGNLCDAVAARLAQREDADADGSPNKFLRVHSSVREALRRDNDAVSILSQRGGSGGTGLAPLSFVGQMGLDVDSGADGGRKGDGGGGFNPFRAIFDGLDPADVSEVQSGAYELLLASLLGHAAATGMVPTTEGRSTSPP